jgi:hypothetical protein
VSDYLLMIHENEAAQTGAAPNVTASLLEQQTAFAARLRETGSLRDSGRFHLSKEGKRVRHDGERVRVEDGPFLEAGRALGSYYWLRNTTREAAERIATECPTLPEDEIDVRPLMKGKLDPAKADKPGKVFGFAVLGNASNEESWVKVMDRIQAETENRFPDAGFLGGLRLEPPTTGRRVATQAAPAGPRRAVFDGPFLESKEVIGGIFFIRMLAMEDAVRWASATRFVVHGALEIRELWRT